MFKSKSSLSRKKEKAILAMLTERSLEEAARVAGVSARTLHRWKKEPDFDSGYREAKRAVYFQSTGRLQQLTPAAVATIAKTMVDPSTPPSTKIRAAEGILNHASKAFELEELEARVSELERRTETSKKPKT